MIVNPAAGNGRGLSVWESVREDFETAFNPPARVHVTERRGAAIRYARRIARDAVRQVGICGGDGLINEIVNGFLRARDEGELNEEMPVFVLIPAGTGNDYVRSLGLPVDPGEALRVQSESPLRTVDAGRVNGRFLVNVGGVGFDAEVASTVDGMPGWLKRFRPRYSYVYGVLRTLPGHTNSPLTLRTEDQTVQRTCFLVAFGVGTTEGGGMKILPDADPADGLLDVLVAGDLGTMDALRLFRRIDSGEHLDHDQIEQFRTEWLQIDGPEGVRAQVDGELLGGLPIRVRCIPGALKVACPPDGPSRSN